MTVISARWRSHRPFQRKRKWHIPVARYRKKLRRRVHITTWEFEGNIRPTNWTEDSWVPVSWVQRASGDRRVELRRWTSCSKESQCSSWAAIENEKDTMLTAITSGSKYFSNVRSPAPSHTQTFCNPFRNLTNKVRGKIFHKEVFLRLSACIPVSLSSCVLIIIASVCIQHIYVYFCLNKQMTI